MGEGKRCEACNLPFATNNDTRPHVCRFTYEGEVTPWDSVSASQAGNMLKVENRFIVGLAGNAGIRHVKVYEPGELDARAEYRFNYDDIAALKAKVAK